MQHFFSSAKDAEKYNKNKKNTNSRYSKFTQYHFTAGDKNQFTIASQYTPILGQINIDLISNIFGQVDRSEKLEWPALPISTPNIFRLHL